MVGLEDCFCASSSAKVFFAETVGRQQRALIMGLTIFTPYSNANPRRISCRVAAFEPAKSPLEKALSRASLTRRAYAMAASC